MEIFQYVYQIIVIIIVPWSVWVTKSLFNLEKKHAVAEELVKGLKEDLNELKAKLDKLIEIQTLIHLKSIKDKE